MVDEQPAFQVLVSASERDAEKVGAAARARRSLNRGHGPHDLPAQRHVDEPVGGIAADQRGVRGQLDRTRIPVVDRDQLQGGTVAEHDLDVGGDVDRASVVEHDRRSRVRPDVDDVMDIGRAAGADSLQHDRLDDVGAGRHLHVQPAGGPLHGERAHPVGRNERRAEGTQCGRRHDVDLRAGRNVVRAVDHAIGHERLEEPTDLGQRREAPFLVAPGRELEGFRVA